MREAAAEVGAFSQAPFPEAPPFAGGAVGFFGYDLVRTKLARINSFLQEHISGAQTVQLFNAEEKARRRFHDINDDYRNANVETIYYYAIFYPMVDFIGTIGIAVPPSEIVTLPVTVATVAPEPSTARTVIAGEIEAPACSLVGCWTNSRAEATAVNVTVAVSLIAFPFTVPLIVALPAAEGAVRVAV